MVENQKAMPQPEMRRIRRIHFVGIGGVGMCGIAEVLLNLGYQVSGSDLGSNAATQRLESLGYELELLETAEELAEVLGALTPEVVIIDAAFEGELEGLAAALRTARQKANGPIRLLVMCSADTMGARLASRRVGADALLFGEQTSDAVLARIEQIVRSGNEVRYRILVVEDDHAQGLFAESILRNAGMEAEVGPMACG